VKNRLMLALAALIVSGGAGAQSLDLNLSNDAVEGTFEGAVGGTGMGKSSYDFSVLFSEREGDNNWLVGGGYTVAGDAGSDVPGLELGVSIKLYTMEVAKYDVTAIPLGGHIRYSPPTLNRFYAQVQGYWAPGIVTLYDGDEFYYAGAKFGYEVLPSADVYIGYRNIYVDIKNRDDERVSENWMVGVKLTF